MSGFFIPFFNLFYLYYTMSDISKKAGQTKINLGQPIKIIIADKDFKDLIGATGRATHPFAFGCTKKGWIGIYLDEDFAHLSADGKVNFHESEVEIINIESEVSISLTEALAFEVLMIENRDNAKLQKLTGVSYTESINILNGLRKKIDTAKIK